MRDYRKRPVFFAKKTNWWVTPLVHGIVYIAFFSAMIGALQYSGLWSKTDPGRYVWKDAKVKNLKHCVIRAESDGPLIPCQNFFGDMNQFPVRWENPYR